VCVCSAQLTSRASLTVSHSSRTRPICVVIRRDWRRTCPSVHRYEIVRALCLKRANIVTTSYQNVARVKGFDMEFGSYNYFLTVRRVANDNGDDVFKHWCVRFRC
jgi:hypothetical protein